MSTALILAGHGSHISPNTAAVVWAYVDALREGGIADEITATFWKEQPHFADVLRSIASDTIVIVPLFTASGYFSKEVIPSEMGLSGRVTKGDGKTIYYTKTLGEHSAIPEIVQKRVTDVLENTNLSKNDTSVAIIGHGTKRSARTRKTTQHQVELIAAADIVAHVVDAYLDDEPNIPSIYERTSTKNIIVVPFFLAQGSHTTQDVPDALGITYGDTPAEVHGRTIYYTLPIGTDDVVLDLIVQLARETGLPFERKDTESWRHIPQNGTEILLQAVQQGELQFGELSINLSEVIPVDTTSEHILTSLSALRQHIRENPFRPLASTADLARDWCFPVQSIEQIPAIIETIYPNMIADWEANRNNTFEAQSLQVVLTRQQGMYRDLAQLDEATIQHHVSSVCGRCIKHPTWHAGKTPKTSIPCPSACNFFLSAMKEDMTDDG